MTERESSSKPRLKLRVDGTVEVLIPGSLSWSAFRARDFIREQYGTVQAFALRFGLNYGMTCDALRDDRLASERAGGVAHIRQMLGLKSAPTRASMRMVAAYYRSRGLAQPGSHS
jgi:hypothetical protein